jgi:hypothetical protein
MNLVVFNNDNKSKRYLPDRSCKVTVSGAFRNALTTGNEKRGRSFLQILKEYILMIL